jgi:hypothetical protein
MLRVAMEGEKRQQKRATVTGAITPRKSKTPQIPVIGSGSTWGEDEVDLFKVNVEGDVDAKQMIPEKWFDFGGLEHYRESSSFGEWS